MDCRYLRSYRVMALNSTLMKHVTGRGNKVKAVNKTLYANIIYTAVA